MNKALFMISLIITLSHSFGKPSSISIQQRHIKKTPLKITTKLLSLANLSFTETLTEDSEIGLFTTYEYEEYPNKRNLLHDHIKSKAIRSPEGVLRWKQDPEVYLDSRRPLTVFAYYPYQAYKRIHPALIPIQIHPEAAETRDYKYGTLSQGQRAVSRLSPIAKLSMKNALSLLSFELYPDLGTKQELKLTSIQVGNQPGRNTLSYQGTMNIVTGKINPTPSPYGATRLKLDKEIVLAHEQAKRQSIRIIPTYLPIQAEEIEFLFTINGKSYTYIVPKGTCWKKGYEYVYRFNLTTNDIRLNKVTSSVWP